MPIILIILAILIILTAVILFCVFPSTRRHPDLKVIDGRYIAHRGLHNHAKRIPENSLTAFEEAISSGYMIETDIHITRDGNVVVFHDDDLRRMCGVEKKPEDMTAEQLCALRLEGTDERIPTLREFLDTVDGKVPILIEFKCTDRITCRQLCSAANDILSEYNGKYMIQSFYPFVLGWYRKNRPDICRGQLASAFYRDKAVMKMLGCLLFDFIARPDFVSYEHNHARNFFRMLCTALGAFPICWTLRTECECEVAKKHFKAFIFEGFIPDKTKHL